MGMYVVCMDKQNKTKISLVMKTSEQCLESAYIDLILNYPGFCTLKTVGEGLATLSYNNEVIINLHANHGKNEINIKYKCSTTGKQELSGRYE